MEGELVLDEEVVVEAVEAMEISFDTMKEKRKHGRKAQISITERERERERELSRIVCYSKHNDKMYIRTPFIKFYN